MKRRHNREIMVFSISFLDVIASALGAILILFIVQYKKTVNARVEISKSEKRHVQCTQVLEWVYSMEHKVVANEVVVTNRTTDSVQNTPYEKRGTATQPNSPNNNVIRPVMRKEVKPTMKVTLVDRSLAGMKVMKPPMKTPGMAVAPNAMEVEKEMGAPVEMGAPAAKDPKDPMQPRDTVKPPSMTPPQKLPSAKAPADSGDKKKSAPLVLPPKPKRKALATCITSRESVIVAFYDYDEPDGDSIMVTFNGRHATKLVLQKAPTKRFRFALTKGKYNIISIKNLSNGFYPINTANVSISGCGKARWKMKSVGVTRVIYIYRK